MDFKYISLINHYEGIRMAINIIGKVFTQEESRLLAALADIKKEEKQARLDVMQQIVELYTLKRA